MKKKLKLFFTNNPNLSIKAKSLAKKLKIKNLNNYAKLKENLHLLVREDFLKKSGKRFKLNKESKKKYIGTLQLVSGQNYGFVIPDNKKHKDIFISEKHLSTAFNGDKVEVVLFAKRSGKNLEGQITAIIKRAKKEIVGTLKKSKSFYFVEPDETDIYRDIYISQNNLHNAKDGDKVVVSKIIWESGKLNPEGKITEILGKAGTYDAEIASIAREFGLRYKFSKSVLNQAAKLTTKIPADEIAKRLDYRNKKVFTIDPETAKDFDDAVSIEKLNNNNVLIGIHIADVSYYLPKGTPIFKEAEKRATSVYLVGKVIPMLPEKLSNNICSLVPNKDRLTFSVIVEFTPNGKMVNYKISKTVINSKRRFTYDEVQTIIETRKGELKNEILELNRIAKILRKERTKKGSINFTTPDIEFVLDKNGNTKDIKLKKSNESHQLIEEFMLLANRIISAHVNKKEKDKYPFVYRIHDLPNEEKIMEFSNFVNSLGYSFNPKAENKSLELQKLLESTKGTPEEAVINEIAIRSMAKAVYSTKNIGHFGLGFKYYSHFTSPIRRFPDLVAHHLIYNYISKQPNSFGKKRLEDICEHSSQMERNAINAERLSIKLKQIEFLKNKIGETFDGIISGVTHFGIFIELNETLAEGLIHMKDLDDDYYIFDEKNYSLIGSSSGRQFRLGDKIKVKLKNVNEEKREIDFTLL